MLWSTAFFSHSLLGCRETIGMPKAHHLAERRTVHHHTEMPIYSPHESASGGNENSSGVPLPRSLLISHITLTALFCPWAHSLISHICMHPGVATVGPPPHHSRMLHLLACLPFLPAELVFFAIAHHKTQQRTAVLGWLSLAALVDICELTT